MTDNNLAVYFHQDVLSMKTPDGLFERAPSPLLEHQVMFAEGPERIANIKSVLERGPSAERFDWRTGRHATDREILTFHTPAYLEDVKSWNATGHWPTDTTYLPKGGLAGLRAGAGTTCEALSGILSGEVKRAYALVRPPSHHAAPDAADGYCFFNAVGMAAELALKRGLRKIAILDWDVHHGNGIQEGFYDRRDVLYISMHMNHGAWGKNHRQTGEIDEVGRNDGAGYNLNLPLPMGATDSTYCDLMKMIVVPALESYEPELIIVSNGQDANQFDPNGRQCITMSGFHEMASIIASAANRLCDGKLLVVQEGGYNVAYVGFCAYATALGFLGTDLDLADPLAFYPENKFLSQRTVRELMDRHPLLGADGKWCV